MKVFPQSARVSILEMSRKTWSLIKAADTTCRQVAVLIHQAAVMCHQAAVLCRRAAVPCHRAAVLCHRAAVSRYPPTLRLYIQLNILQ